MKKTGSPLHFQILFSQYDFSFKIFQKPSAGVSGCGFQMLGYICEAVGHWIVYLCYGV